MKKFPVLMGRKDRAKYPTCPESVPWDMVAGFEARAQRNHRQSLSALASRGGLDPVELVCLMTDQALPGMGEDFARLTAAAIQRLMTEVAKWTAARPESVDLAPGWVWTCPGCNVLNPVSGAPPDRVGCSFCRVVYSPKKPATPNGAGEATHEHRAAPA